MVVRKRKRFKAEMSVLLLNMFSLLIPDKKEPTNIVYLNTGFYEIFLTLALKVFDMYLTQKIY